MPCFLDKVEDISRGIAMALWLFFIVSLPSPTAVNDWSKAAEQLSLCTWCTFGKMCNGLEKCALHCGAPHWGTVTGTRGGGAAVGSRGHGLPYHSTERAWRSVRRHCGSSPSTAAHKLNLLCTWLKLFPLFCRMRKLLLLIIFPLNAVGSTFSFGTTSIFLLRSHP